MVAPPLAFSNSAIHAFCAASCAVDPAPAISPEASVDGAPPPFDSLSLSLLEPLELLLPPPQAASASASTQAAANTASHLDLDIRLLQIVDEMRGRQARRPPSERVSAAYGACYLAAKP